MSPPPYVPLVLPIRVKVKVKRTLVQALRLSTGRTAHSGSRGLALLFLDHGTRRGVGLASRPGRSLPPAKTRYRLCRRLDGPQGPVAYRGWVLGVQTPMKFRRPTKIVPNSTRLWKLLNIAKFRMPTPQDVRKKAVKFWNYRRFAIVLH